MHAYLVFFLMGLSASWWLLSVLRYFSFAESWIIARDVLQLVPSWKFFAPEPNKTDYYLYYRVFAEHHESCWRMAPFGRRRWYAFLWNPYRRDRKCLFDLCQLLISTPGEELERLYSLPYLLLLNHVTHLCTEDLGEYVQFAIGSMVPVEKGEQLSIAFISNSHQLNEFDL